MMEMAYLDAEHSGTHVPVPISILQSRWFWLQPPNLLKRFFQFLFSMRRASGCLSTDIVPERKEGTCFSFVKETLTVLLNIIFPLTSSRPLSSWVLVGFFHTL